MCMHLCRKINWPALGPTDSSFLLNSLSLQKKENSTQAAYCGRPLAFSHLEPYLGIASVPLDLGHNHNSECATNNWRVIAETCVPPILVLFIYEYKHRPYILPLGNAGVGLGWICLLGSYHLTTLENIPASLPHTQEDGRSVAVAESSAPGLGNAGLVHVCATSLLLPGARHCRAPGVAGGPVMCSCSEGHLLHDQIAGSHMNFFFPL